MPVEAGEQASAAAHLLQPQQFPQPQRDCPQNTFCPGEGSLQQSTLNGAAAANANGAENAAKEVSSTHLPGTGPTRNGTTASKAADADVAYGPADGNAGASTACRELRLAELTSADLQVIRTFLRNLRAQREQQEQLKKQNAGAHGSEVSLGATATVPKEPRPACASGAPSAPLAAPFTGDAGAPGDTHLEDTLVRLQHAHVPVQEILKEHPKSLGMLIKNLQTHPEAPVAARAKCIYAAWLPKVMAANRQAPTAAANKQAIPTRPAQAAGASTGTSRPSSAPSTSEPAGTHAPLPILVHSPKNASLQASAAASASAVAGVIEQFEALAGDSAWYDAKLLELLEERFEAAPSKHRVRVQFQNCNQGLTEELPFSHIRRRSEAFRVGQLPQVGTTVLAFQQRKSYDLYYDADVLQINLNPGSEPRVLVQYLHGPEVGMEDWLSLQALHRIRHSSLSVSQLKAIIPCSVKQAVAPPAPLLQQAPILDVVSSARRYGASFGEALAKAKGPPYKCCVCGKAFDHPPAHSSHERAHLQQLSPHERARFLQLKQASQQSCVGAGASASLPEPPVRENASISDACTPVYVAAETGGIKTVPDEQTVVKQNDAGRDQHVHDGRHAKEEDRTMSSADDQKLDMKKILLTWKTADDEHIKVFKKKLRQRHPEVSPDAKMCSDTQLLVDGSGVIRNKVVVDTSGEPTIRACTEKERALTLKILSRQAETRKIAGAELQRAGKEYTRFHLPLTLEAVRDLGPDLRCDSLCPDADKRKGSHTFSTLGGRWWVPTLDPLLESSFVATQKRAFGPASQSGLNNHVGMRRASLLPQRPANAVCHIPAQMRAKSMHDEERTVSRLKTGAGVVVSRALKVDGLKVYVNGTGIHQMRKEHGVLVKGAQDKIVRVRHEGRVKSLSDFCDAAGNTMRRVQLSVMITGTDPPLCLADYIAHKADAVSAKGGVGANVKPRTVPPPPVEKRKRGRRVHLDDAGVAFASQVESVQPGDMPEACGFKTTGSLYIGRKILLPCDVNLPVAKGVRAAKPPAPPGSATDASAGARPNDVASASEIRTIGDAMSVVKQICKKEFALQSQRSAEADAAAMVAVTTDAATVAASTAFAASLLLQHLQQVEQQAATQLKALLPEQESATRGSISSITAAQRVQVEGADADDGARPQQAASSEDSPNLKSISRECIVGKMRSISGLLAPHYLWLTKEDAIIESHAPEASAPPLTIPAQNAGLPAAEAEGIGNCENASKIVGAEITHHMAACGEVYVSATWGGAAALWQCTREDGQIEHLEEDEVRAALQASGISLSEMPPMEDASHAAWARQRLVDGEFAVASSAERTTDELSHAIKVRRVDGGRGQELEDGYRVAKMSKVHVKHREMRPAALLAVQIINRLKSTAFANNGMLSSRQGRQRWKKKACEQDLSEFGKSIKHLETNLVWSAVTHNFEQVRHQLLETANNLASVDDAVKALELLDSCILDSFRRKSTKPPGSLACHDDEEEEDGAGGARMSPTARGVAGSKGGATLRRSLAGSPHKGSFLIGRSKPLGGKVRLHGAKLARSERGLPQELDDALDPNTRGAEIIGQELRVRTRCDLTGKFRWMGAKVIAFDERDDVPYHCLDILDATDPAQEPLWICLKRGNHSLVGSGGAHKRKADGMLGGSAGREAGESSYDVEGKETDGLEFQPPKKVKAGPARFPGRGWVAKGKLLGGARARPGAASSQVLAAKRLLNASRNRMQRGRVAPGTGVGMKRGLAGAAARWWGKTGHKAQLGRKAGGAMGGKAVGGSSRNAERMAMLHRGGDRKRPWVEGEELAGGGAGAGAGAEAGSGSGKAVFENAWCSACGFADREEMMLLCDFCDAGWHMDCLPSPLERVPEGEWKCPHCHAGKSKGKSSIERSGAWAGQVVGVPLIGRPKKSPKIIPRRANGLPGAGEHPASSSAKRPVNVLDAHTQAIVQRHDSLTEAASAWGVGKSTMASLIQSQRSKNGYVWQYADGGGVGYGPKRDAGGVRMADASIYGSDRTEGLTTGLGNALPVEVVMLKGAPATAKTGIAKPDVPKAGLAPAAKPVATALASLAASVLPVAHLDFGGAASNMSVRAGVGKEAGKDAGKQAAGIAAGDCGPLASTREGCKGVELKEAKKPDKEGARAKKGAKEGQETAGGGAGHVGCELCEHKGEHKGGADSMMLLCDSCNKRFHGSCLRPPLTCVPKGAWRCSACRPGLDTPHDLGAEVAASADPSPRANAPKKSRDKAGAMDKALGSWMAKGGGDGRKGKGKGGQELAKSLEKAPATAAKVTGKREREAAAEEAEAPKERKGASASAAGSGLSAAAKPDAKPAASAVPAAAAAGEGVVIKRGRGRPRKDGTPVGSPRIAPPAAKPSHPPSAGIADDRAAQKAGKDDEDVKCQVCASGKRARDILLCDACDKGWHTGCLAVPLNEIPKGHWFCDGCRASRKVQRR